MDAITITNGKAEMAWVGDVPWHGLGQQLPEGESIETWTVAAGMNWKILRSKVRYNVSRDASNDPSAWKTLSDRHVLFRSDTKDALGVVGDGYKVVQPRDVLEFFHDLTDAAGFKLETAGTLFGGRRFWALANTGESSYIRDPKDRVNGYLLLSTACDGSMATEARYTNVRVVCHNTLSLARDAKARVKVTHRSVFRAADVKAELGIETARDAFADAIAQYRLLASARVSNDTMIDQTLKLFGFAPEKMKANEIDEALKKKAVIEIGTRATAGTAIGSNLDGAKGTQWAWVNAVTEYVDHAARARDVSNRMNSAWFGKGDELKSKALEIALEAV